jgi:hypothetical protein
MGLRDWTVSAVLAAGLLTTSLSRAADDLPPADQLPEQSGLPDPLKMRNGMPVTTQGAWLEQRKPELRRLFQHYMYGYLPAPVPIEARVTKTADILGGKGMLKEVEIRFPTLGEKAPRMHLAIFLPRGVTTAPMFLSLNSCGNIEALDDLAITDYAEVWRRENCKPGQRGTATNFWCVEYLVSRGYGLALYHESEIDPDQHDFTDGIHPFLADPKVPEASRPGTIAAWSWGLHRAIDYLTTDAQVDPFRICLIGHSRRGKTALFAAAMDERVALVVPHQSGTGGMALSRDSQQETVERINRVFPHWFDDAFVAFGGHENRLPFDQHCLVAMVAPRPLLDTEGAQDAWANFPRSLESLQAADPVYRLLGVTGINGTGLVQNDEPIIGPNYGRLMQYRLDEKHTLNRKFWEKILDFADAQLKATKK